MDRKQKILGGVLVPGSRGVEIGPLFRPLVSKAEGSIVYVDHVDTATLLKKYANDPNVPAEAIAPVDAVWGDKTLLEALGEGGFDYVLASHVIEHVPDLASWLNELLAVLASNGELRFAVPDKRFTFDHLRNTTTITDVLAAYAAKSRVPQPRSVIDHIAFDSAISVQDAWEGRYVAQSRERTPLLANGLVEISQQASAGIYHDVHCWVFTPQSFGLLMAEMVQSGLVAVECSGFHDTAVNEFEFFVGMRHCEDLAAASASWALMAQTAKPHPAEPVAGIEATRLLLDEKAEVERQLAAVLNSRSWRLFEPARRAIRMVRGT